MSKKIIPAFKIGKQKDKNGRLLEVTKDTLKQIVKATKEFVYQDDKFPIVIGHPKEDSPAWGWINKANVTTDGELLLLEYNEEEDLNPQFKEWLKQKLYKNVSISLRPDLSIKHLGFLGAKAPAVSGLPAVEFSEEENDYVFEFAEYELTPWWNRSLSGLLRGIKNWIISKENLETANLLMPEYLLQDLAEPPKIRQVVPEKIGSSYYSENNFNENLTEDEMNELEKLKAEKADLEAKLKKANDDAKAHETTLSAMKLKELENTALAFCEGEDVKKKIKPAEKSGIVQLLVSLEQQDALEFSEGEEKKTISPADTVRNLIKRLPDVVDTREFASGDRANHDDTDGDDRKLGQKIAEEFNKKYANE